MNTLVNFIKSNPIELAIISGIATLVLFLLYLSLAYKYHRIKKKYFFIIGDSYNLDMEGILIKNNKELARVKQVERELMSRVEELETKFSLSIQNVGIVRYNAFGELGPELSFSIALLDEYLNGIVVTSIHGRQQSSCYGKAITKGKSEIPLSIEEEQAINKAIKGQFYSNSL